MAEEGGASQQRTPAHETARETGAAARRAPTRRDEVAVTVSLAEYERIWNEIFARFESQRQAFNYLVVLVAAAVGLIASERIVLAPRDYLWIPVVVAPLGFIFFDNELMIWGIVKQTVRLQERLGALVGDPEILGMERRRFDDPRTRRCHHALSLGRWTLFLAPIVLSITYAALHHRSWAGSAYTLLLAADLALLAVLLWGMARSGAEQRHWGPRRSP